MIPLQIAVFSLYALTVTVLFGALVPAYLGWLWWGRRRSAAPGGEVLPPTILPHVDVLVPVHGEAGLIERKLDNLAALDYPRDRLRILVIDGASTDGTWGLLVERGRADERLTTIRVEVADKTRQLNVGLRHCRGDWVIVTDADARLKPETLRTIVAVGEADQAVGVIGATVIPERAHVLEHLHWRMANLIRRHESDRGSASMVAGPCYAFRRTLFDQFPDDVVGDDVYVALFAATSGMRVALASIQVIEQRSPVRLSDLLRHKLRKTDAYLREIFRFLPHAARMKSPARAIFLWRAAHLTVLPVLVALAALGSALTLTCADIPLGLHLTVLAVAAMLFAASWWGLGRRSSPVLLLAHGVLLASVTLAALVFYPFSRQTASLTKVANGSARRGGSP
jgi:biofilm PGA synthesis N-glycosyltransferase PgaC